MRIFDFRFLIFDLICVLPLAGAASAGERVMHPPFKLLDGKGESVLKGNTPVSTMRTCGGCHDVQYIVEHNFHGGRGRRGELNCFVCHLANPDNGARMEESRGGRNEWVATATLAATGAVKKTEQGWKWNETALRADGMIGEGFPRPVPPSSSNCGQCHGQVHKGDAPLVAKLGAGNRLTEMTGQIFSSQKVKDSGMNLAGKDRLAMPWDVHAARMLECRNCHYSPNNPAYAAGAEGAKPEHLAFEPRRVSPGEFLMRPDHNFAHGAKMRGCESCHEAQSTHDWLPYTERHLEALSCEACHVPKAYAPARQQVDGTVIDLGGNPIVSYRGVDGPADKPTSLVHGYEPVLLPRKEADGSTKLAPYNLVASWYWVSGEKAQRVQAADLKKAFLDGANYQADVLAALDANHDGKLEASELRLDTAQKVEAIRRRLEAVGVKDPRIAASVQSYGLTHGVVGGEWATQRCSSCHGDNSRTAAPLELAGYVPGGVMPALGGGNPSSLRINASGALICQPAPGNAGRYVIGHDRWVLGDIIGALAVVGAVAGIIGHGGMRILAAWRRLKA